MIASRFILTLFITLLPLLSAADGEGNSEVFRNIIIEAGKTAVIDSALDYNNVDRVAVTARCTTCDSATNSLSGLVMHAAWSVSNALVFCPTELKSGTTFLYYDAGSAIFQVFGSKFRLTLQNKDKQGIIIQQLTIHRRL